MKTAALCFVASVCLASHVSAGEFKITSSDVVEGQKLNNAQVLNGFGCEGGNVSPAQSWSGAPGGTKSYAVTLYDPDAPTGSGWWHWVAFNIPSSVTSLAAGASQAGMPEGSTQSRTDFGAPGFGGACPPEGHGTHRYQLKVYALNVDKLNLDENASGAMVGYFLGGHSLGVAEVTGTFER